MGSARTGSPASSASSFEIQAGPAATAPSIAADAHPAVDHDLGPGDEARLVGGEEQSRVRRVAAVAFDAERDSLLALPEQFLDVAARALAREARLDHGRVQLSGHDRVHAYPLGSVLDCDDA